MYYKLVSCSPHFSISVVLAPLFQLDRKEGGHCPFWTRVFSEKYTENMLGWKVPIYMDEYIWSTHELHGFSMWLCGGLLQRTWILGWFWTTISSPRVGQNDVGDALGRSSGQLLWAFGNQRNIFEISFAIPQLAGFLSFWGFDRSKVRRSATGLKSLRPKEKPPTSKMIRHPTSFQACLESE